MLNFYRNLHPAGRLGLWGLPVLIVVAILLFDRIREEQSPEQGNFADLITLSTTTDRHVVQLGTLSPPEVLSEQFAPLDEASRARVLRRLDTLTANYRPLGLSVRIESGVEDAGLEQAMKTLDDMLAIYRLTAAGAERNPAEWKPAPLALYCPEGEMPIAYAFLSAIAPYIHAAIVIVEQPGRPAGQMLLHFNATPRFTSDGRAVFN